MKKYLKKIFYILSLSLVKWYSSFSFYLCIPSVIQKFWAFFEQRWIYNKICFEWKKRISSLLKFKLQILYLSDSQSHYSFRLLLLQVNYIQLQRKSYNFHADWQFKRFKRILRLKPVQILGQIIMTCA